MQYLINTVAPAGGGASMFGGILPILFIFVLFYFLLIRPQSQRYKKHQQMLTDIQRGDQIVTNGGIIGKVTKATDEELTVDVGEGMKLRVRRSMIADVLNRTEPANDTGKKKK